MTRSLCTVILLMMVLPATQTGIANMVLNKDHERLKVFYTQKDLKGWYAVLRGKIISFSTRLEVPRDKNVPRRDVQEKSKATVRLYGIEGIHEGDELYVINSKNLIVARFRVRSIFKSASFGDMLIGYGNFRLASIDDRVVQRIEDNYSKYAYINKARGDYYIHSGKTGQAISEYKKALKLDRGNPEARIELGYIYLKQEIYNFAYREFTEAYKRKSRLYDKDDQFRLLTGLAEVCLVEGYESSYATKIKEKFREEGIKYCREALRLFPDSEKMNFYLGIFYFQRLKPLPERARDHFLRVIEINPANDDAYALLASLYLKSYLDFKQERNLRKAVRYARKSIELNPYNKRARSILRRVGESGE